VSRWGKRGTGACPSPFARIRRSPGCAEWTSRVDSSPRQCAVQSTKFSTCRLMVPTKLCPLRHVAHVARSRCAWCAERRGLGDCPTSRRRYPLRCGRCPRERGSLRRSVRSNCAAQCAASSALRLRRRLPGMSVFTRLLSIVRPRQSAVSGRDIIFG